MFYDDVFDLDKVIGRRFRILNERLAKQRAAAPVNTRRPEEMIYEFCVTHGHPPSYLQILDMLPPEVRDQMKATRAKMDEEYDKEQPRKVKRAAGGPVEPQAPAPAEYRQANGADEPALNLARVRQICVQTLANLTEKCGKDFARAFMKDLLAQHGGAQNLQALDPKHWQMFVNACELAKIAPLHRTSDGLVHQVSIARKNGKTALTEALRDVDSFNF